MQKLCERSLEADQKSGYHPLSYQFQVALTIFSLQILISQLASRV